MAKPNIPGFKTADEAAEILDISARVVRGYCKANRIKTRRIGKLYLIADEDLAAFANKPRRVGNPHFLRRKATRKSR